MWKLRTVINNGKVIDPKNKICSQLNIAIEYGKITDISRFKLNGDIEIDADGLIITPGFIDMHMHEDNYNNKEDKFQIDIFASMLRMGVTTVIGGNCGIGAEEPDMYLDTVDRLGVPVNIGLLVPHGSLRKKVKEDDRYKKASMENVKSMKEYAKKYLANGCLGISYGIRYIPGLTEYELEQISSVVRKENKFVAAHVRDDAQEVINAALEFINVGLKLDIPVQLSHIGSMGAFGQMSELLALVDDYRISKGVDIVADCYPYTAFSTRLGTTTYDTGFTKRYQGGYGSIEIAEGIYKGQRLNEDLYHRLRKESPEVLTIAYVMKDEEVDMALGHPNVVMASDGLLSNSQGHPRAGGAFPRFIKKYVKEKKVLNLYQAIEKITAFPARRLGINKGSIGIGDDADIVIFDYEQLSDMASFKQPVLPPEGIKYVLIKGEVALRNNEILKSDLGRSIRK